MKLLVLAALLVAACGTEQPRATVFGGDRPVTLRVPRAYDHDEPTPLLLVLHGYSVNGAAELAYARLDRLVDDPGVLVLAPDGTPDTDGNLFWNAWRSDCEVGAGAVKNDDSAYLIALVDEVSAEWNVDPKRVYVFGHSNGGFMAHRLACDHADRIAAIASLAGAAAIDPASCAPSEPVSVLQLHGDADSTVSYLGGTDLIGKACPYLSASETVDQWANHNGCAATRTAAGSPIDLDSSVAGDETQMEEYAGCRAETAVALWTLVDGEHIPTFKNDVGTHLWAFLDAHPKP